MTLDDLLTRLPGAKRSGSNWMARCPAHDDRRSSLSVSQKSDRLLLHCFAGCTSEAITTALGISIADLFINQPARQQGQAHIVRYDYHDADGTVVYRVCRGREKRFWQERPVGRGGWISKGPSDEARVLYRLPEVREQIAKGKPVFVVEGEKDVESLRAAGFVATTNVSGAEARWLPQYTEALRGAYVVVLSDNDNPGIEHAGRVADALLPVTRTIRQVMLPGLAAKGDVTDWLGAGGTPEQLRQICSQAARHREGERLALQGTMTAPKRDRSEARSGGGPRTHSMDREEAEMEVEPWPILDSAARQGLAGEILDMLAPHVESDPAAILVQLLVAFGSAVGRGPHWLLTTPQYLNEFTLLVGATASGRKGTSWREVRKLLEIAEPTWVANQILSGLSTGEGLVHRVRDPGGDGQTDPGVGDKRLLVVETEFGAVLGRSRREGNTLSQVIRQAWDSETLQTLTRKAALRATDPHVSIIGHITPSELNAMVSKRDAASGFLNRFLIVGVRRTKFLPFGGTLGPDTWQAVGERLQERLRKAREVGAMPFDGPAAARWPSLYRELDPKGSGAVAAAVDRGAPHVRRLACLYALLDGWPTVGLDHLVAAEALWRYAEASVGYVLGDVFGDETTSGVATALEAAGANGLTTTDLHQALGGHTPRAKLHGAIKNLDAAGRISRETSSSGGRPVTRFRLNESRASVGPTRPCELSELSEERPRTAIQVPVISLSSLNSQQSESASPLIEVEV